ncbi:FAS-associated death domain protein isoform X1 [Falco peregrinus]|uniref:FAS-associated death domain protein isoform X1 n=1 Tax=Falco peregrinus TaxID=8954 RepID=UPI00247A85CF|nr:FAS-associated death domain protein isoform X1 [Falco peregrinus]XP_055670577.1 FAS-associated death domain protein isoform X1 [Falco peregrinus]
MDPFLALLHHFSTRLSSRELDSLKFLCGGKIGKRKLESVESGGDLFSILLEQQLITSTDVSFLQGLLVSIEREDLVSQLKQFVEEGEVTTPEDEPDVHEKRLQKAAIEVIHENVGRDWKMLMRKLGLSEVKLDRIVAAHPFSLQEQVVQALREWQKWKGKDAKVTDLIKALRDCHMNLVADRVEQKLLPLNNGTR